MSGMMMPMYFTWSLPFNIIFESWVVSDNKSYAWSFVVVMAMGFMRHLFAQLRHEVVAMNWRPAGGGGGGLLNRGDEDDDEVAPRKYTWLQRAVRSRVLQRTPILLRLLDLVLFGANCTLGFLNMLVTMTYNPAMLIAVVAGEMLGVLLLEPPGGFVGGTPVNELENRDVTCH